MQFWGVKILCHTKLINCNPAGIMIFIWEWNLFAVLYFHYLFFPICSGFLFSYIPYFFCPLSASNSFFIFRSSFLFLLQITSTTSTCVAFVHTSDLLSSFAHNAEVLILPRWILSFGLTLFHLCGHLVVLVTKIILSIPLRACLQNQSIPCSISLPVVHVVSVKKVVIY